MPVLSMMKYAALSIPAILPFSLASNVTLPLDCPAGQFLDTDSICRDCPVGQIRPAGNPPSACSRCLAGTFSSMDGDQCVDCALGTYTGMSGRSQCDDCPVGRYGIRGGGTDITACQTCPFGTFGNIQGAVGPEVCRLCRPGFYSRNADGAASCAPCAIGRFSDQSGASACESCPTGTFATRRGLSECESCSAGEFRATLDATECSRCPRGTFGIVVGAANSSLCQACHRGTYSGSEGQTECDLCPKGEHTSAEGMSACDVCAGGGVSLGARPRGAVRCCPQSDSGEAAVLRTPPGKNTATIVVLDSCDQESVPDHKSLEAAAAAGLNGSKVHLGTLNSNQEIQECVTFDCGDDCRLELGSVQDEFEPGEELNILASIGVASTEGNSTYQDCASPGYRVSLAGFGCTGDTLTYFIAALTGVVVATVVIGLILEWCQGRRTRTFVENSVVLHLPDEAMGALPTLKMLFTSLSEGLRARREGLPPLLVSEQQLPREYMDAFIERNAEGSGILLHVKFAVSVDKQAVKEVRRQLLQTGWKPPESLAARTEVKQEFPTVLKTKGTLPGMELVEIIERLLMFRRGMQDIDEELKLGRLHLEVARSILSELIKYRSRIALLAAQYVANMVMAGGLAAVGYTQMTSCEEGYPRVIHGIWSAYILLSGASSFFVLKRLGGRRAREFLWCFKFRLLLRYIFSCILLTDLYQDASFPVIAKRCGFDLWIVSTWLVVLGIGVMQVLMQVLMMLWALIRYTGARTPEERERLLVEGSFLALRGSDNLVLVYAVRPAVEERLGGSSSWAMKMTEARIAFFRFIFEDVEQSALQLVFLFLYHDANTSDQIWVGLSVGAGVLLSFTLVVQCLPEVRDWLWYRVLPVFPAARRFPVLRVFWLLVVVAAHRMLSIFPWLMACSPSGDTCTSKMVSVQPFWGCVDGETAVLGIAVRKKVVLDILRYSGGSICSMGGAIVLATMWTWVPYLYSKWTSPRRLEFRRYSVESRLAEQREEDEPVRPQIDADHDPWLVHARPVWMASRTAPSDSQDLQVLQRGVEQLDEAAFRLTRAFRPNLGGRVLAICWSSPDAGSHLSGLAHRVQQSPACSQLDSLARKELDDLCDKVQHVDATAHVRWRAQKLLAHRPFLKGGLSEKADMIKHATTVGTGRNGRTRDAPLRFVHWWQIEANGALPRRGEEVDQVLANVRHRLDLGADMSLDKVERHVVPFFLSHRWMRTLGKKGDHHPDTVDNIKAQGLVAFAKRFEAYSWRSRLKCEVVFWIDYCCCDQRDQNMDLGIAALPLYIASCLKVLVWRTPDFEKRCWPLVERLLAYSFNAGGLMPYVMDDNFAAKAIIEDGGTLHAEPGPPAAAADESGVWQVLLEERQGGWRDFPEEGQQKLEAARISGLDTFQMRLEETDQDYQMDLKSLTQRNLQSQKNRRIRRVAARQAGHGGGEAVAPVPTGGHSSSANPTTFGRQQDAPAAARIYQQANYGDFEGHVHRRARKLPNPLDFETCQVTRMSDRRSVAQLVDVALMVPALEVFADRQPVEWGLTEVIEQHLAYREPLPMAREVPRTSAGSATSGCEIRRMEAPWLEPTEVSRREWQLVVRTPEEARARRGRNEATDAIFWIDSSVKHEWFEKVEGAVQRPTVGMTRKKPTPEELDHCFDEVDRQLRAEQVQEEARDQAIRKLIYNLKADQQEAVASGSTDDMEAAINRARDVESPDKTRTIQHMWTRRLQEALELEDATWMRTVLNLAAVDGCGNLPLAKEVRKAHTKIYEASVVANIEEQLRAADHLTSLHAVHQMALQHGKADIAKQALARARHMIDADVSEWRGRAMDCVEKGRELRMDAIVEDLQELARIHPADEPGLWKELKSHAERAKAEVEAELELEIALGAALKATERKEEMLLGVQKRADELKKPAIKERVAKELEELEKLRKQIEQRVASQERATGIAAEGWDVIKQKAGIPNVEGSHYLTKVQQNESARVIVQRLVDATYKTWSRNKVTKDRQSPLAARLEVRQVVHVQNTSCYGQYLQAKNRIKRAKTPSVENPFGSCREWTSSMEMKATDIDAATLDVKTRHGHVKLDGLGNHKSGFLDQSINEVLLWHGTKPASAAKITDARFDVNLANNGMFGKGLYFAESCMKSDEYSGREANESGLHVLLLCRVILGSVRRCEEGDPRHVRRDLEASCKPGARGSGGRFHSVLGDREKTSYTFREFIVYDDHQVYPEYIVWYKGV